MASFQIILISVFSALIIILLIFIIKSVATPKKVSSIKNYIKQGKIQTAIKMAKAMISKDSRNIVAHYYLGKAYMLDNKDELAIMEFKIVNRDAIFDTMNIDEKDFRLNCGRLYKKFNQFDDALSEYILLSKMDGTNPDILFETGQLFELKQKFDHALGYYNKSLALKPQNGKAHLARGKLLIRAKQFGDAKKSLEVAIKTNPEIFESYYHYGKILKEVGEFPAALDAFEKATRDSEYRQKAIVERGICYITVKQLEKAKNEFNRVISLAKEDTNELLFARYFLAHCYEKERNIEKAVEQWNIIHKKNKTFRDVASKLIEFRSIHDNDAMKEYLTCSDEEFKEFCKTILSQCLGFSAQSTTTKKFGCEIVAADQKNSNWREMRKALHYFVFFRDSNPIDDSVIRGLLDFAKKQNYVKTYILTSSDFTRVAMRFAENRPVELINKMKFQSLLEKLAN